MTTELNDLSSFDSLGYADWILKSGIWNGRQVSWTEASDFYEEIQPRVLEFLFDPRNEAVFSQLACIGSRNLSAREIQHLDFSKKDLIVQAGLRKLWKKHKKEILIVGAALVVIAVVVVVAVSTGGTAAGAAAAAGGAALDSLNKDDHPQNTKNDPAAQPLLSPPDLPETAPAIPLEESSKTPAIIFEEKGVLIDGHYFSYQDILRSGGHLDSRSTSFSLQNQSPCQPDLPINHPSFSEPDLHPTHTPSNKSWFVNVFETIGRGMIDAELLDPAIDPLPESKISSCFSTLGPREPHIRIGGINGINTSYDQAVSHANYMADFVPDHCIDWVYNRSRGPIIDLAEVFTLNYAGFSPNTRQLLQENWTAFHQENADRPQAKYLQFCHSQGALHVRNALAGLPKEIRDRIMVVAIAPAAVVPKGFCYKSFNYASKKDIVHLGELVYASALDPNECGVSKVLEMALEHHEELILLDPHPDATGIDHDYKSPTFKELIKRQILDYLNHNGEYK